jgi:hypothetical protein
MVQRHYTISAGSAQDYDDLVAIIHFPHKFGLIVSQERAPGEYEVSVHSFIESAADDYDFQRKNHGMCVSMEDLLSALSEAKEQLDSQLKFAD